MLPSWLNALDIVFIATALLFAWKGMRKGIFLQAVHIMMFLIMGVVFLCAYSPIFDYLGYTLRNMNEDGLEWLACVLMLIVSCVIYVLARKCFSWLGLMDMADEPNRIYGCLLGFIRGMLSIIFIMIFLSILGPPKIYDGFSMKSRTGKLVCFELLPRIQPHRSRGM
jgi:uncharacterized membrane protein required for colicin V production